MTVRGICRSVIPFACALAALAAGVPGRGLAAAPPSALPQPAAASWSGRTGDGIQPARIGSSAVYDAPRNRLIVFGGAAGAFQNDTWAFDLGSQRWTELATTGAIPAPRQFHSATIDLSGNMVVYGGYDGRLMSDMYRLDLATLVWQRIEASTRGLASPYRYQHGSIIVQTEADTMLYVFGGTDGDSLQNTVYRFVLGAKDAPAGRRGREINTWKFFATSTFTRPPVRRLAPAVAPLMTPAETSLVVMGGFDGANYLNDLWVLNLRSAEWDSTRVNAGSPKPAPRTGHVGGLDAASLTFYAFGGWNGRTFFSDTWTVPLGGGPASWSARDSSGTGPPARFYAAAALTPAGLAVAAGGGTSGSLNDAWRLPLGSGGWTDLTPALAPPSRYGHVAVYDAARGRAVAFGGSSSYNQLLYDMWTYDPGAQAWSRVTYTEPALLDTALVTGPGSVPRGRSRAAAVYVPGATAAQDTIYVFGGWTGEFPFNVHTHAVSVTTTVKVIDRAYQRVMFAFAPASGTWTRVIPADTTYLLPPRESASLLYDAPRQRLVLFGGFDGDVKSDTWAFDLVARKWTPLQNAPAARYGHAAAIDASGTRMVVADGSSTYGFLNDVHVFDLAAGTWSTAATSGIAARSRLWPASFVDQSSNSLVVFGGAGPTSDPRLSGLLPVAYGDTLFALDLSTYAWRIVASGQALRPADRFLSTATYLPGATPGAVLFGGGGRGASLNDTWTLSLSGGIDPLATAERVDDGSVRIRWRTASPGAPDAGYTVLRASVQTGGSAGDETVVLTTSAGAPAVDGWLEAEDRAAAPGGTYRYVVLDLATGYRAAAGDVTLPAGEITERARFVLRTPGVAPVTIALRGGAFEPCPQCMRPAADGVRVGLFDVRGRLVRALDLEPAEDAYSAVWDGRDARGLLASSGVYVVRVVSVRSISSEEPAPARLLFVR